MKAQRMRVFITGATGFLGGALAHALAQEGAEIHALARTNSDRGCLNGLPIAWHQGDIEVRESLKDFAGADWIIHCAGRLGEPGVPEGVYHRLHVEGTRNVLAAAQAAKRQLRVLHISSPGVLGPIVGEPAAENVPLAPSNPYERSKAAAEAVVLEFATRSLQVVVARPEFVYGPGDKHVLGLFRAVLRGQFFYINRGRHFCHPTHIADAVAGILLCLKHGRPGEIYHITGPRPVTFQELGTTIATALGVHPPRLSLPRWAALAVATGLEGLGSLTRRKPPLSRTGVAFFSEDRRFSWQKAQDELGYMPQYDLEAGVTQTVEWYRLKGWL
jgi:nucleoside-diphosphate-sugar epimerase